MVRSKRKDRATTRDLGFASAFSAVLTAAFALEEVSDLEEEDLTAGFALVVVLTAGLPAGRLWLCLISFSCLMALTIAVSADLMGALE